MACLGLQASLHFGFRRAMARLGCEILFSFGLLWVEGWGFVYASVASGSLGCRLKVA